MIILNEKQYFEQLLTKGFPSRLSKRDIIILAKHWRDEGFTDKQIYDKIVGFCKKWSKKFVEMKYQTAILDAISKSAEPSSVKPRKGIVSFSGTELAALAKLQRPLSDLLFVMMCLCKIYDRDNIWVNSKSKIQLNEICRLAKLQLTNAKQERMLREMIIEGAVEQCFPNLLQLKMVLLDKEEPAISFVPSEDMVDQWRIWFNRNYAQCEVCGTAVRRTNNKVKYCSSCALEVAAQQRREYNAKHR